MGISAGALMIGGAANSAIGAYSSAQSQKTALNGQAAIADINAQQSELAAQQELFKGNDAVADSTRRAGQVKSAQRTALAANGVDLGYGNAPEILAGTDFEKEQDANTITANAVRAAWGYRTQGANFKNEASTKRASASSISPLMAGANSLLGSASSVATSWYSMNKAGVGGGGTSGNAYLPDSLRGGK